MEGRCCGLCLLLTSIRPLINLIIKRQFRGFISHDPPGSATRPLQADAALTAELTRADTGRDETCQRMLSGLLSAQRALGEVLP